MQIAIIGETKFRLMASLHCGFRCPLVESYPSTPSLSSSPASALAVASSFEAFALCLGLSGRKKAEEAAEYAGQLEVAVVGEGGVPWIEVVEALWMEVAEEPAKISNSGNAVFVGNDVSIADSAGITPANSPAAIFIFRDLSASFSSSSNEDWP
eukprot:CCRYP_018450-RA/>CCRYP_018450-RA protein AED:0.14 eAED:0.32 QI:769/0/0.33/0.66/0/0/3/0/153